jgi:hypothetical protein
MADFISGIKHITPSYPIKPVRPAQKERETDRRKKPGYERPDAEDNDAGQEPDGQRKPTIDEHV